MPTIPSDSYRAAAAPHDARTTTQRLDLDSAADASITLDGGLYELKIMGTLGAWIVPGASSVDLAAIADGDPAETGFHLSPGHVVTYHHDTAAGDGDLHAIPDDTGTSTLLITRKGG